MITVLAQNILPSNVEARSHQFAEYVEGIQSI